MERPSTFVGIAREATQVLVLLVGAVALFLALKSRNESVELLDSLRPGAERAALRDGLIGNRISLPLLVNWETLEEDSIPLLQQTLLWIIDLDECVGCFGSLMQWNHLAEADLFSMNLVLIGEPDQEMEGRLHALSKTRVWFDRGGTLRSVVGRNLPTTKIVISENGIVVMADGRDSGQECGWSFEAQLGALVGELGAENIRIPLPD